MRERENKFSSLLLNKLNLFFVCCCLVFASCSKDEEPSQGSADTTTSPSTSTGDNDSTYGEGGSNSIAPDIRRGINTQQFFIGKEGNSYNKFPFEFINDSAVDSQGNHIAVGHTMRNFTSPYILDVDENTELDPNIFIMKTTPTGEISWVFSLGEYSKDQHFPNTETFQLTTGIVGEFTLEEISFNGREECVSVSVDINDNIYCLASLGRKNEATEETPARYTQIASINNDSSFILLKLNPDGELVWVRQFGETLDLNLSAYMTITESNYFTYNDERPMEFAANKYLTPTSMAIVGNKILIVGDTNYNLVSATSGDVSGGGGFIVEYDLQGNLKNILQSPDNNLRYNDVVINEISGNIYIGGMDSGLPLVLSLSEEFNLNWKQSFSSAAILSRTGGDRMNTSCRQVHVDQNGNVYCVGTTIYPLGDDSVRDAENSDDDIFVAKIHYLGFVEYIKQIDDSFFGEGEYIVDTSDDEFSSDSVLIDNNLYILGTTKKSIGDYKQLAPEITPDDGSDSYIEESIDILFATFDITSGELQNVDQLGSSYFDEFTYAVPTSIHSFNGRFFASAGVATASDAFCLPDIPDEGETFYGDAPLDGFNSVLFDLTYRLEHKKNIHSIPCVIGPTYENLLDTFSDLVEEEP